MPPISKFASFVGTAKETTPGTAVAATSFTPATTLTPEDVKNYTPDTGLRGSFVDSYNQVPTQGWGTYTYGGNVYADTIGVPLKAILGAEDLTGAGPYIHNFSVLNSGQPPTYTISDYNGFNTRQFPYGVCSDLEFSFDASGLLTFAAQWTTQASSTTTKPTQTFSTKSATAGYVGVITVGGSATTLIESGSLKITRAVTPIIAVNGTTSPTSIFGGAVAVTGQFTAIYQDDTFLTPMLNGTAQVLDLSFTNSADILQLHCTKMLSTKAPVVRGKDYLEITVDFTAVANTTDVTTAGAGYSPIKATLTNTTSTAY